MKPATGVVDQHVDIAQLAGERLEERLDRFTVAHVEDSRVRPTALRLDRGHRRRQPVGVAVTHRHIGAEPRQRDGRGGTDPASGAGHDRHPARQQDLLRIELHGASVVRVVLPYAACP